MAATANPLDKVSYTDLYERWEKGNWRATEIDFAEDRRQWNETFDDVMRRGALWNYSLFLYGEDSVAANLSPYIDAAPLEEQKYFLATQQVDEARHAVFFARFFQEVIGVGGDSYAGALAATQPELTWGFRQVFDRLDRMSDELRADRSLPQLSRAITLYHVIVEATLAQPGQHFIDAYLNAQDLLPGFRAGMANVALDEQRHIGFGVKLLSDLIRQDPECKDAMIDLLREVMPWTASVFVPPNWDRRYVECFGFTMEEIAAEGFHSVETKLRTVGLTAEEIQRALPVPLELPVEERVTRALRLVEANVIGEKAGPASTDPEVVGWMFDNLTHAVDQRYAPSKPTTIQWRFTDTDPWYIRLDNGSTEAVRGRAPDPDLTLECSWEDWTWVLAGRRDPRKLVLRRRLRPRGDLRLLLRAPKLFGQA